MYKKMVPFKDYNDKPQNKQVTFLLEIRDVFKIIPELNAIFSWRDSLDQNTPRDLSLEEMREFFDNFERVLLAAWGELSADGQVFDRTGKYEFEQSKCWAAFMEMLLGDMGEIKKILDGIMPAGMEDLVRKQGESLERMKNELAAGESTEDTRALEAKIAELQARVAAAETPAVE